MNQEPPELVAMRRALGHQLATLREAAEIVQQQVAHRTGYSRPSVAKAEAGRQLLTRDFWQAADELFQADGVLLTGYEHVLAAKREHERQTREAELAKAYAEAKAQRATTTLPPSTDGTSGPVAPSSAAAVAARDSLAVARWASSDQVAPAVIEHVFFELGRIAVDYVTAPLPPLLVDILRVRDTMFELLRSHPSPRQSRELFFLTGTACLLLAHASQNLGDPSAAMAQASTALTCAEQADHNELRAWVHGTQALIAEWSGQPSSAVTFARSGQRIATTSASQIRLFAIEGRALARVGEADSATAAVHEAQRIRDSSDDGDELSCFGGVLAFPLAKQLFYAGSTFGLLNRHQSAEQAALQAIRMYEDGPPQQRSYGDESLARTDVATARLASRDLEGAWSVLLPVLKLPANQRIRQVGDALVRLRSTLEFPPYLGVQQAVELMEQLENFGIAPVPRPPAVLV